MKLQKMLAVCLLVAAIALVGIFVLPTDAQAATEGYYTYTVSNGKATITGCDTAISGDVTIPSTLGGYPVITIGENAFSRCYRLTSVTIGDSVTSIGDSAFYGCNSLTSITIPASVTSIDDYAFGGCGGLKDIYLTDIAAWLSISFGGEYSNPLWVDSQYKKLYLDGKLLTDLVIPEGVTSIGERAFYKCDGLTSITIPDSVASVGNHAFSRCSGLARVTIGNGVTSIGSSAFYNCSSLTSITIPDSVISIGNAAFSGSGLTSITIPDSVTSIGNAAFSYCRNLTSITIPDSVTSIGSSAFSYCSSLTSITIPEGVTSIGSSAFHNCNSLTSITIPDSVTSIGNSAFYGCSKLESVTIPFVGDSRKTSADTYQYPLGYLFGTSSYDGSVATKQYYYGSSTLSLTSSTYYIPASLKSVTVTGGKLLYGAFYNCSSLESITLSEGVTSIGDSAFYNCSSLEIVTIPNSVTRIGWFAFYGCSNLESITIPFVGDSRKTSADTYQYPLGYLFGTSSYDGSVETKQYYYGSSTSSLTYSTCYIPVSLKFVTVTGGELLCGAFYNCSSLESVTLQEGVTGIGERAFEDCSSLESVTIPDSVTSIGHSAFYNCSSLESIAIPDSVTSIGNSAFSRCSGLKDVYYASDKTKWDNISIGSYNGDLTDATIHYNHVHDYSLLPPVTVAATCTADGYTEYTCAYGDTYRTAYTPALGHDYSITVSVAAPTCLEQGYTVFGCSRCPETTKGEYTSALGHDHSFTVSVAAPTCLEQGYTVFGCGRCSETTKGAYTKALGHDYSRTVTVKEPACLETGSVNITCARCDSVERTETVAYLGHKMVALPAVEPSCTQDGLTIGTGCERCQLVGVAQKVIPATGHSYADGKCTNCGEYEGYTVTFLNWNGDVLSAKTYHYGDTVEVPVDPTKAADNTYTYEFAGWDKEVVACTGDATYTATYAATYIEYTVKFLDEDGKELSSKTYYWGNEVTAPVAPTKAADNTYTYEFAGWDKEVVACTGDATYTATYTATYIEYTVVFKNWNGDVLSTKTYHYGDAVEAPVDPVREADGSYTYTFAGWDKEITSVTGDVIYTAQFAAEQALPDFTGDGQVTDADAIYLLRYTLFPESYPLGGNGDVNCDGQITDADAIYLLRHTLFPENYPLYPKKEEA